jgi:peptide/nickel transport system permease protein
MGTYLLRRLGAGIFVVLFIIWLTFSLSYLQKPYGAYTPAWNACNPRDTPSCLHQYTALYGFNQSYIVRLYQYIQGLVVHFNLGYSYKQNQAVFTLLKVFIPRTLWLAVASLILATLIALPMGIYQAWRRNSIFDYAATGIAFILYSIPAFVLGFVLLDVFSFHIPLGTWAHLPSSPTAGINAWAIFTDPIQFVLPVVTLTALSVAGLSRFMRSSVLDVLVQDYIRTARAKGCNSRAVLFRHTMRNALGPIVVIIGLSIPILLSGTLIVEDVFNYGGIGYETLYAATNDDLPTILGITIVVTMATIIGNIAADIGLALINPRVRIEGSAR